MRRVPLVVVGLLALASCGSDGHDTSPASTTPNTLLVVSGTDPAGTTAAAPTTTAPATTVRVTAPPTTAESAATTTSSPYLAYRGADWIEAENARTGTDAWKIVPKQLFVPDSIDGYANTTSALIGDTVSLHVASLASTTFTVEAYRMGFYGGLQGRLVWTSEPTTTAPPSDPAIDPVTHMAEADWPVSLRVPITSEWPPGTYLLKLVSAIGAESYVPLTIRDDDSSADLVAIDAVTTWQAYNDWGSCSLYQCLMDDETPRSTVVSFDRPIFGFFGHGAADYLDHELPLISLAEERGLDITYITDIDLDQRPGLVLHHRAVLSLGHDEYYSTAMYDALESARDRGVNLAFLGANAVYRRIRLEPGADGTPARRMVNYRSVKDPATKSDPKDATVDWRDAPLLRPEITLIGIMYECAASGSMTIVDPENWVFAGTHVRKGAVMRGLIGSEYDRVYPGRGAPKNLEVLSHSFIPCRGRPSYANSSYYSAPSGAGVFATGTIKWVCAIDATCTKAPVPAFVRQVTINVLEAFAAGPAGSAHPSKPNPRVIVRPPTPTTIPGASTTTTTRPA
ncbi:MAG: N,N-dimethylformamidase beta subunit family domain-containing protein [Acidimicrobiales bacterium]